MDTLFTDVYGIQRTLNPRLVEKQGLTQEEVDLLKQTHAFKSMLREKMLACADQYELIILGRIWTKMLFMQQKIWKFPLNEDWHDWSEIPWCRCQSRRLLEPRHNTPMPDCPVHSYLLDKD